jgi:ferric-dicitrate binding protein FerR (iron transport regulator)
MINRRHEIDALIARCLSSASSADEKTELTNWMSQSAENRKYFLQMKNLWESAANEISPADINTEKALSMVERRMRRKYTTTHVFGILQKAAAILLLPLLALSFWLGRAHEMKSKDKPVYSEVTAAFGTRSVLTLPDGSTVWLNSGSSLKYPRQFENNIRNVYLTGEGYFEVQASEKKPFIVHTKNLNVQATGTRFNVNASGLEKNTSITLVEGKVTVSRHTETGNTEQLGRLTKDEQLVYDTLAGSFRINKADTYKYIAWKDGKLIFRNESLEDVLKKIGYYYNVDMEIRDSSLKEYRYRATFEEESIEEIMNLLRLSSPLDYKVVKREPLPDGSFPKKKIIIFPIK